MKITKDFLFVPEKNGYSEEFQCPLIEGVAFLRLPEDVFSYLSEYRNDVSKNIFNQRQTLSLLGIQSVPDLSSIEFNNFDYEVSFPVELLLKDNRGQNARLTKAISENTKPFSTFSRLYKKSDDDKEAYPIGNLTIIGDSEPLSEGEITKAIDQKLIYSDVEYTIDENSFVHLPINHNHQLYFQDIDFRKNNISSILHHPNIKLDNFIQQKQVSDSVLSVRGYIACGLEFSSLGHLAIVDNSQLENIHVTSPIYQANRSTGLNERGFYNKRPLVLHNNSHENIDLSKKHIPIHFYQHDGNGGKFHKQFKGWTPEKKERVHKQGLGLTDILPITEDNLNKWFSDISPHPSLQKIDGKFHGSNNKKNPPVSAYFVNNFGVRTVHFRNSYHVYRNNVLEQSQKRDTKYAMDDRFQDVIDASEQTHDQGSVFISHHMPSESHMDELAKNGVKRFIFRGMEIPKNSDGQFTDSYDVDCKKNKRNFYLDKQTHIRMMKLAQQGCEFVWYPDTMEEDKEPRVFYKGFWVLPGKKDVVDVYLTLGGISLAMFGASVKDKSVEDLRPLVNEFLEGMITICKDVLGWDLDKVGTMLAVLDGNGPALMQVAREEAQKLDINTVGFGMDFEQVGETPDFSNDAIILFKDNEIEYRQTLFEYLKSFSIINIGGKGTAYEAVLSALKMGLSNSIPLPIILIDLPEDDIEKITQEKNLKQQFIQFLETIDINDLDLDKKIDKFMEKESVWEPVWNIASDTMMNIINYNLSNGSQKLIQSVKDLVLKYHSISDDDYKEAYLRNLEGKTNYWSPFKEQYENMYEGFDKPLCDPWLASMMKPVRTYDDALKEIGLFLKDPCKYWEDAGIPNDPNISDNQKISPIQCALMNHQKTSLEMGWGVSDVLIEAAKKYSTMKINSK